MDTEIEFTSPISRGAFGMLYDACLSYCEELANVNPLEFSDLESYDSFLKIKSEFVSFVKRLECCGILSDFES